MEDNCDNIISIDTKKAFSPVGINNIFLKSTKLR